MMALLGKGGEWGPVGGSRSLEAHPWGLYLALAPSCKPFSLLHEKHINALLHHTLPATMD
jgi:hypothetical protein